jgi:hypothetical protein
VVLLMVVPAVSRAVAPDEEFPIFMTVLVMGAGLVISQLATAGRRYLRRVIVPTLDVALKPLRPSEAEVGTVLAELKQLGHKIGAKLRATDVVPPPGQTP